MCVLTYQSHAVLEACQSDRIKFYLHTWDRKIHLRVEFVPFLTDLMYDVFKKNHDSCHVFKDVCMHFIQSLRCTRTMGLKR